MKICLKLFQNYNVRIQGLRLDQSRFEKSLSGQDINFFIFDLQGTDIDSSRESIIVSLCFALSILARRALGVASHSNSLARLVLQG